MVVKPTAENPESTYHETSSSSKKTNMASSVETQSYSKSYGRDRDRRQPFKSQYGRLSSYEPSSSRFSCESSSTTTSSRQSRYDTTPRSRMAASMDRDLDFQRGEEIISSFASQSGLSSDMYGRRRAYSVDRDAGFGLDMPTRSASKVRPWREKLKLAEAQRRASESAEPVHYGRRGSADRGFSRSYSVEASTPKRASSRYEYETVESYRSAPRRSRAASLSRAYGDSSVDYEGIIAQAQRKRSASLSRYDDNDLDVEHGKVVRRGVPVTDLAEYQDDTLAFNQRVASTRGDLTNFVLRPGERFEPEQVKVWELPSGRKAVTYSTFSEYGHGDRREANAKIAEATLRTQCLEQTMSGLEDFVKRNRSYFPAETTIYQQIRFYQLNEQQLREIGERPDAEVYGVKVREKLCVPPGTDVAHILRKYYKSSDVDVEYSSGGSATRPRGPEYEVRTTSDIQQDIRRQVEAEFETREKKRVFGDEGYEVRAAPGYHAPPEDYNHVHPRVSPNYIQSVYRDAGLNYDDIYQRSPTMTSPTASLGSDLESLKSSTSSRRRYDSLPNFTAKLRDKQCMTGQTIKFNCSVSGTPFPEITWFKGNKLLGSGGRFTFSNNYGLLSLEIANVVKEDAGLYSVKAINPEGEVLCSASLDVIELDFGYHRDGTQKPYFIAEAANSAAEIDGEAIFEARATGKPAPSFKWAKDNILLSEGPRVRMYDDTQGNAKLIIRDIRPDDHGLYFLTAENKSGKAKCAATLRVVEQGKLEDRQRSTSSEPYKRYPSWPKDVTPTRDMPSRKEKGLKPWFVQMPPYDVKLREGETLTLKCMVDGDPKPVVSWTRGTMERMEQIAKVTWCKGVRELQYTERHRIVTEADHYMMQIKQTTPLDRGQYIVIAENAAGRVHANCWVNILPHGEDEEAADLEFRRFKLELPELDIEAVSKGEVGKQAPMFVKRLPRERTVSAGSLLELKCVVREATPEIITDTSYKTRVKGKLELKEETIKIGPDGSVSKKTAVVDLDKPAAAAGESDAKASEVKSEAAAEEASEHVVSKKPPIPKTAAAKPEKEVSPLPSASEPAGEPVEKVEEPVVETVAAAEEAKPAETSAAKEPVPVVEEPKEEESAPLKVVSEVLAEASTIKVEEVVEDVAMAVETKKVIKKPWDDDSSEESDSEDEVVKKTPPKPAEVPAEDKTPKPMVEEPKEVEAPKAEECKAEEVVVVEVKTEEEPKAEAPKAEEPKVEEPKVEETKVEKPKVEEPKVAETKVVEAKVEETKSEQAVEKAITEEPKAEVVISEKQQAEEVKEVVVKVEEVTEKEDAPAVVVKSESAAEEVKAEVVVEVKTEETTEAKPEEEKPKAEEKPSQPEASKEPSQTSQPDIPEPSSPTTKEESKVKSESEGGLPLFEENLRNIMVPEGATATFTCSVNANSNASVAWTKDGQDISTKTNVTVSSEECVHSLTISNVSKSDEGSYTCTAENKNGTSTSSGTLTVEKSITKGYISALDQPEKKKKKKKEKKDKGSKSEKGGKSGGPKVEETVASEEEKPKEEEVKAPEEEPKPTEAAPKSPQDSESEASSSEDSDSDSDSESESESSESESDSEYSIVETKHKEANLRVAHVELGKKMLPQSDLSFPPGSVISLQCQVSHDPLRETFWLCEGRQKPEFIVELPRKAEVWSGRTVKFVCYTMDKTQDEQQTHKRRSRRARRRRPDRGNKDMNKDGHKPGNNTDDGKGPHNGKERKVGKGDGSSNVHNGGARKKGPNEAKTSEVSTEPDQVNGKEMKGEIKQVEKEESKVQNEQVVDLDNDGVGIKGVSNEEAIKECSGDEEEIKKDGEEEKCEDEGGDVEITREMDNEKIFVEDPDDERAIEFIGEERLIEEIKFIVTEMGKNDNEEPTDISHEVDSEDEPDTEVDAANDATKIPDEKEAIINNEDEDDKHEKQDVQEDMVQGEEEGIENGSDKKEICDEEEKKAKSENVEEDRSERPRSNGEEQEEQNGESEEGVKSEEDGDRDEDYYEGKFDTFQNL